MEIKKRNVALDYSRAIAILLVILNHSISIYYVDQLNPTLYNSISINSQLFMVNSYIISRLGVPLFLFISGALLLNKNFNNETDIKKFYKNNLLKLLIAVTLWNIIYYLINIYLTNEKFSIINLLLIILFLNKSVYGHMWYMPMILGMYLFLPMLSILLKKINFKILIVPLIISTIAYFVIPHLNILLNYLNEDISIKNLLELSFSGAQYGIYIILGYYVFNKKILHNLKTKTKLIVLIIAYIITVIWQIFFYKIRATTIVYYNFIGILLFSIMFYSIFLNANLKDNKVIQYLSINSLGLYFIHFPILILIDKYINFHINRPISVLIILIIATIISIGINEILKKINITKKYLLRIK